MECDHCCSFLLPEHKFCPTCGYSVPSRSMATADLPARRAPTPRAPSLTADSASVRRFSDLPVMVPAPPVPVKGKSKDILGARKKPVPKPSLKQYTGLRLALVPAIPGREAEPNRPADYQFLVYAVQAGGESKQVFQSRRFRLYDRRSPTQEALAAIDKIRGQINASQYWPVPRQLGESWYVKRFGAPAERASGGAAKRPVPASPKSGVQASPGSDVSKQTARASVPSKTIATKETPVVPHPANAEVRMSPVNWSASLPTTPRPDGGLRFVLPIGTTGVRFEINAGRLFGATDLTDGRLVSASLVAIALSKTEPRAILLASGRFDLACLDDPGPQALEQLALMRRVAVNTGLGERFPGPGEHWFGFSYEVSAR